MRLHDYFIQTESLSSLVIQRLPFKSLHNSQFTVHQKLPVFVCSLDLNLNSQLKYYSKVICNNGWTVPVPQPDAWSASRGPGLHDLWNWSGCHQLVDSASLHASSQVPHARHGIAVYLA